MSKPLAPKGTYPNNIADEMKKRSKLQDSVAYKANLSRSVFTSLLNGQRPLNMTWAKKLAKAIECNAEDLFVHEESVPEVAAVAPAPQASWNLVAGEIEVLVELAERELHFMQSTGRNIAAGNLQTIVAKLQSQRNAPIAKPAAAKKEGWSGWVFKPKTEKPKQTRVSVVQKLSRPWTQDELADALSALRNGMSNEEVAGATGRPMTDITSTKVLFGWLWHAKQPKEPSKAQVLQKLENLAPSTRQAMYEPALV